MERVSAPGSSPATTIVGDGDSTIGANRSISTDGRYVVFTSSASNLVAGDTNGASDIFRRDLSTGTTLRVSVGAAGEQGNSWSSSPSISADGRYVAFVSAATNLVPGVHPTCPQAFLRDLDLGVTLRTSTTGPGGAILTCGFETIVSPDARYVVYVGSGMFLLDRQTQVIECVSVNNDGLAANGSVGSPSISADGRFVAFQSTATNLAPGVPEDEYRSRVYVHDRLTRRTTLGSATESGELLDGPAFTPLLSDDGHYLVFGASATNVVSEVKDQRFHVYRHDLSTGMNLLLSRTQGGVAAGGYAGSVSAEGRYATLISESDAYAANGLPWTFDVFLADAQTGAIEQQSVGPSGELSNNFCNGANITPDARFVAINCKDPAWDASDANERYDVLLRDRNDQSVTRVSQADISGPFPAATANGPSQVPSVSTDGRFVSFLSTASNLLAGLKPNATYLYVKDRATDAVVLANVDSAGAYANGDTFENALSGDGQFVAFSSDASNLVANDGNGKRDIFVRDLVANITERISVGIDGAEANDKSSDPRISTDGRYVAFLSSASNLVSGDGNGKPDVFVRDRMAGSTLRATLDSQGAESNVWTSYAWALSGDGVHVAFIGYQYPAYGEVFLRNLATSTTTLVSVSNAGDPSDGYNEWPALSFDGRYVYFLSGGSLLFDGEPPECDQCVFRRDVVEGVTAHVEFVPPPARNQLSHLSVSSDGLMLAFNLSYVPQFHESEPPYRSDVFVLDVERRTARIASLGPSEAPVEGVPTHEALLGSISADGQSVVFSTNDPDVLPGNVAGVRQVYLTQTPVVFFTDGFEDP